MLTVGLDVTNLQCQFPLTFLGLTDLITYLRVMLSSTDQQIMLTYLLLYGERWLCSKTPDSQSREPGFESPFTTVLKFGHFHSLHDYTVHSAI